MESRQTTAGRLRSSFFDMHLRVPFLEGRVLGLDAVSVGYGPLVYPGRQRPLPLRLAACSATSRIATAPRRSARSRTATPTNASPGGINRIAWQRGRPRPTPSAFGDDSGTTGSAPTSHRYALQNEEAERRGLTSGAPPDLRRAVAARDAAAAGLLPRRDAGLPAREQRPGARLRAPRSRHRRARRADRRRTAAGPASPTPDGRGLVFQRLNFIPLGWRISGNAHLSWNDLYRLDLEQRPIRPLTRGCRAHEPDVSPDGTQVACVVGTAGGARQLARRADRAAARRACWRRTRPGSPTRRRSRPTGS